MMWCLGLFFLGFWVKGLSLQGPSSGLYVGTSRPKYILAHGPFRERSAMVPERHLVFRLFACGVRVTHGLHSSSVLWFISRILKGNPKKELRWSPWVQGLLSYGGFRK